MSFSHAYTPKRTSQGTWQEERVSLQDPPIAGGNRSPLLKATLESRDTVTLDVKGLEGRQRPFRVRNALIRECMAEFIGTMTLVAFGNGVVAQTVLSNGDGGSMLSIHIAWGLAVTMGIFATGGVSGAHLNPAVSLALAVFGRMPWRKVPTFMASQLLGGFMGALLVYSVYFPALQEYHTNPKNSPDPYATTAGIFSTFPQAYETIGAAFWDELVGTALLLAGIFAIGDPLNATAQETSKPVAVGMLVGVIGMSFGFNTGYAINPARDLGPRLFTSIAGWGGSVFTRSSHYFWVPVVAPLIGGVVGAGLYEGLVGHHQQEDDEDNK